jgi:hypothetical protein
MKRNILLLISALIYFFPSNSICQSTQNNSSLNLIVDGKERVMQLDGIGVNANTRSWNGEELKPALNLLLDSLHATIGELL